MKHTFQLGKRDNKEIRKTEQGKDKWYKKQNIGVDSFKLGDQRRPY